jgi:hypothetical protein
MAMLKGMQLALLPEVEPYWLENSGRPKREPLCSGRDEAQPPSPAQLALELPEATPNVCTIPQPSQRRHSPKGKAVGWIKERQGNAKREKPTTNYYYCWDEPMKRDGQTKYQRHQVYVPVGAIAQVQEMIAAREPVAVVLDAIEGVKAKR